MADKQAALAAALRKTESDDEPRAPSEPLPSSSQGTLKLRKSNLLGIVTWEECLAQFELNSQHDYDTCVETLGKMLRNVIDNPTEAKYRKIRTTNANFAAKVYSCKGAPALFSLAGFKDSVEQGFLVLPDGADLAPLQRALDSLADLTTARKEAAEKKRKLQQEKEAAAREARAQKAREAAEPGQYDAAVAGAGAAMVDEDEAMVAAIEEHMDSHPELKAGRVFDAFEIERQVPGPGGSVVASVAASVGTEYFDYVAYMKRSADGSWSCSKVEAA